MNPHFRTDEERIWLANYPIGITIKNNRYTSYKRIKHSIGNKQSLINDLVNAIIEDREGDFWFATNNGISFFNSKTGQWRSVLSAFEESQGNKSHICTNITYIFIRSLVCMSVQRRHEIADTERFLIYLVGRILQPQAY